MRSSRLSAPRSVRCRTIGAIPGCPAGRRSISSDPHQGAVFAIRTWRRPTPGRSGIAAPPRYPAAVRS
jgi:hypothetical protein